MSDDMLCSVYVLTGGKWRQLYFLDDIQIERSLENFAYGFSCSLPPSNVDFGAGDRIKVMWNEENRGPNQDAIFCGYIDRINVQLAGGNSANASCRILARSYVMDMIDSVDSFEPITGDLSDVIERVCKRYGVGYEDRIGNSLGKVLFECENQSPFQVLNGLVRSKGALLVSNGWGVMELVRALGDMLNSSKVFGLQDILSIDYEQDWSNCYRHYKVTAAGETLLNLDKRMPRPRYLEIGASNDDIGIARAQLANEKKRRFGLSQRIRVVLRGWKAPDFPTHYYENANLLLKIPELGIFRGSESAPQPRSFFVYALKLNFSKYTGMRAELSLCEKEAFTIKAEDSAGTGPLRRGGSAPSKRFVVLSQLEERRKDLGIYGPQQPPKQKGTPYAP